MVWYCPEYYKLNLQKTYLLIGIHLPLLEQCLQVQSPCFQRDILHLYLWGTLLCSSQPAYLQPAGKVRHHSSPAFPCCTWDVPFASTLFCAADAHFAYTLTSTQPKIQEFTLYALGSLDCSKYSFCLFLLLVDFWPVQAPGLQWLTDGDCPNLL